MDARSARRAGMVQSQTCIVQIAVASAQLVIFAIKLGYPQSLDATTPSIFAPLVHPNLQLPPMDTMLLTRIAYRTQRLRLVRLMLGGQTID